MTFAAYLANDFRSRFSVEGRDTAAGILGVYDPRGDSPITTAETLEQLEREAWAYLGREPEVTLYLVDADGRVHRIMINEKHHAIRHKYSAEMETVRRWTAILAALLTFAMTCLIAASVSVLGACPLVGFIGAVAFYTLLVRAGLFNEIEGALLCEILLILFLLMMPAVQQARRAAAERQLGQHHFSRGDSTTTEMSCAVSQQSTRL